MSVLWTEIFSVVHARSSLSCRIDCGKIPLAFGRSGGMADAVDSKSTGITPMRVRLPPSAPHNQHRGSATHWQQMLPRWRQPPRSRPNPARTDRRRWRIQPPFSFLHCFVAAFKTPFRLLAGDGDAALVSSTSGANCLGVPAQTSQGYAVESPFTLSFRSLFRQHAVNAGFRRLSTVP